MRGPGHLLASYGLVAILLFIAVPAVHADAGWFVVVASIRPEDPASARQAAERAAASLRAHGDSVFEGRSLEARLADGLSTPFVAAPASLRDRLTSSVEQTLTWVVDQNFQTVRERAAPIFSEAEGALVSLNRDDDTATALANLCLLMVRVEREAGRPEEASRLATSCVRAVPDIAPDRLFYRSDPMHPPAVRAIVQSARAASTGSLTVEAPSAEGRPCTLRINGRPMGTSLPASMPLPPGRYSVQVECESRPGRVHTVDVGPARSRLTVDVGLDEALGDARAPHLVYPDATLREERIRSHVALLAAGLDLSDAVIIETAGTSRLEITLWSSSSSAMPTRSVALDATRSVPEVIAELRNERGEAAVAGRSSSTGDSGASADDDDSGPSLIGPLVLGGIGLSGIGIALTSLLLAGCEEEDPGGACVDRTNVEWGPVLIYGGGGLVALGVAILWLVLDGSPTPSGRAARPLHLAF